jgi:hypothetical protein
MFGIRHEQTTVCGLPVWFSVCAENDCQAVLIGPFFSEEACLEDEGKAGCDNAHFIITYAVPNMMIRFTYPAELSAREKNVDPLKVFEWISKHEYS